MVHFREKIFPGAQPSEIPPLKSEMIEALSIMMEALAGGHHAEKEMPRIVLRDAESF